MADDFIGLEVAGVEELRTLLAKVPDAVGGEAVDEVNKYLVNVLKQYPPYKHVKYKDAYGGWKSEKQRRYVMARISEGTITPGYANRSQEFSRGWKTVDKGINSLIVNEVPYGRYLMGDTTQARMMGMIGWDRITFIIRERMPEIIKKAVAGVKKGLAKLGIR